MYEYLEEFIKLYYIIFNYDEYTKNELYLMNNIIKTDNIIETNNSNIIFFIGLYYYFKIKNINKAKEYYLIAIELNNSNAMNNYALLLKKENKKEEAKNYYLMAIELNNSNAMNNYANFLYKENKKEEAKEYYLKAIKLNNSLAMVNYAITLEEENKIEKAKKYYLKAIELNNKNSLSNYLSLNQSNLQNYIELSSIKSNITKDKLLELEKDKDVFLLKNKLKKYSEIKECVLCYEEKTNIPLNCFYHMVCTNCYIKVYNEKCPFCRFIL